MAELSTIQLRDHDFGANHHLQNFAFLLLLDIDSSLVFAVINCSTLVGIECATDRSTIHSKNTTFEPIITYIHVFYFLDARGHRVWWLIDQL